MIISFEAGKARKRATRMIAAKLDYPDVTSLLNALLDGAIETTFPEEIPAIRAEEQKLREKRGQTRGA